MSTHIAFFLLLAWGLPRKCQILAFGGISGAGASSGHTDRRCQSGSCNSAPLCCVRLSCLPHDVPKHRRFPQGHSTPATVYFPEHRHTCTHPSYISSDSTGHTGAQFMKTSMHQPHTKIHTDILAIHKHFKPLTETPSKWPHADAYALTNSTLTYAAQNTACTLNIYVHTIYIYVVSQKMYTHFEQLLN